MEALLDLVIALACFLSPAACMLLRTRVPSIHVAPDVYVMLTPAEWRQLTFLGWALCVVSLGCGMAHLVSAASGSRRALLLGKGLLACLGLALAVGVSLLGVPLSRWCGGIEVHRRGFSTLTLQRLQQGQGLPDAFKGLPGRTKDMDEVKRSDSNETVIGWRPEAFEPGSRRHSHESVGRRLSHESTISECDCSDCDGHMSTLSTNVHVDGRPVWELFTPVEEAESAKNQ
uniref:Uncharacterized protein n=1 Tax=Pyrodinium bahamense TaxID=73915 RepID=A0A7S0A9C9_9DINO|mmetsp:Transcript_2834/g.7869  ORF Transcript_2834/g.7869 Transcript_2834/m.7869 type:complete len:230 (+) Transcript_2834:193-882(+)